MRHHASIPAGCSIRSCLETGGENGFRTRQRKLPELAVDRAVIAGQRHGLIITSRDGRGAPFVDPLIDTLAPQRQPRGLSLAAD